MIQIFLEDLPLFGFEVKTFTDIYEWLVSHFGESRRDDIGRWIGGSWCLQRVWIPVGGYQRVPRHRGRWRLQFANEQDATFFMLRWL